MKLSYVDLGIYIAKIKYHRLTLKNCCSGQEHTRTHFYNNHHYSYCLVITLRKYNSLGLSNKKKTQNIQNGCEQEEVKSWDEQDLAGERKACN